MNRKTLFLLIILIATCLLLFLILFQGKSEKNTSLPNTSQNPEVESPKNHLPKSDESISEDFTNPSNETKTAIDQSYLVSQLIPKLPYRSINFSLFYNFSNDKFTLYINSAAQDLGNLEFDNFLKQNGVLSRSWIDNLDVAITPFTPGP